MLKFADNKVTSQGRGADVRPVSDNVNTMVLAAGVQERIAIPVGATIAIFSATGPFWAKFGTSAVAATVPATDIIDGTSSTLNPTGARLDAGVTHISVVAAAATSVCISFYS